VRCLVGGVTVLSIVAAARADLAVQSPPTVGREWTAAAGAGGARNAGGEQQQLLAEILVCLKPTPLARELAPVGEECPGPVIAPPRATPGGAGLLLWAVGGFGAWQLGRSARKLQWSALPEWYHTGGPAQIGHATPFDLGFSRADMPVCCFEQPKAGGDQQEGRAARLILLPERFSPQRYLTVAVPRGPPQHS